jgi:mitochondrial protein import protein ZIM17
MQQMLLRSMARKSFFHVSATTRFLTRALPSSPSFQSFTQSPSSSSSSLMLGTRKYFSTDIVTNEKNDENFSDIPGVKTQGEKYAMVYTCTVCETRSIKKISKQGYHHGCVLVRCPGCKNLHLIADHLGIFEDKGWTIESYLTQTGEKFKKVNEEGVLELTREDILGSKKSSSSSLSSSDS